MDSILTGLFLVETQPIPIATDGVVSQILLTLASDLLAFGATILSPKKKELKSYAHRSSHYKTGFVFKTKAVITLY